MNQGEAGHMPEEKKFTFKQCYHLLQISPKSFLGWLKKVDIDPEAQRDKFDPRKKYLFKSQLQSIAAEHGRQLPPNLDDYADQADTMPAMTLEGVAEQVAALRTAQAQRFDQVDHTVQRLSALLEGITEILREMKKTNADASAWQHVVQRFDHLEQSLRELAPAPVASREQEIPAEEDEPAAESQEAILSAGKATRATKKKAAGKAKGRSRKKQVRGKKLPRALVALRDFANQHHIAVERASAAGKSGKVSVVRGKWLVNSRWAFEALGEQGQHDFYMIFHDRQGFAPCEHCPHSLSAAS